MVIADAVLSFSCEVAEAIGAGSHTVFIGRIIDITHGDGAALIYRQSTFHRRSRSDPPVRDPQAAKRHPAAARASAAPHCRRVELT